MALVHGGVGGGGRRRVRRWSVVGRWGHGVMLRPPPPVRHAGPSPGCPPGTRTCGCAPPEGCVIKITCCGRLPADPDPDHPGLPVRVPLLRGVGPAGPKKRPTAAKIAPYECGIVPGIDPPTRFPVRFYLVAMIFIIFDIEMVFLYPWAVIFRQLRSFGLVEVIVFAAVVFISFVFLVGNGALNWGPSKRLLGAMPARTSSSTIARIDGTAASRPPPTPDVTGHLAGRPRPRRLSGDGCRRGTRGPPAQLPDRPTRGPGQVGAHLLDVAGHLRPGLLRHRDDVGRAPPTSTSPASAWRSSGPRPARPTS